MAARREAAAIAKHQIDTLDDRLAASATVIGVFVSKLWAGDREK
ncbi:MAG: hypothetical protein RIB87_14770 [Pyruvatibacter sp.]